MTFFLTGWPESYAIVDEWEALFRILRSDREKQQFHCHFACNHHSTLISSEKGSGTQPRRESRLVETMIAAHILPHATSSLSLHYRQKQPTAASSLFSYYQFLLARSQRWGCRSALNFICDVYIKLFSPNAYADMLCVYKHAARPFSLSGTTPKILFIYFLLFE